MFYMLKIVAEKNSAKNEIWNLNVEITGLWSCDPRIVLHMEYVANFVGHKSTNGSKRRLLRSASKTYIGIL